MSAGISDQVTNQPFFHFPLSLSCFRFFFVTFSPSSCINVIPWMRWNVYYMLATLKPYAASWTLHVCEMHITRSKNSRRVLRIEWMWIFEHTLLFELWTLYMPHTILHIYETWVARHALNKIEKHHWMLASSGRTFVIFNLILFISFCFFSIHL